MCDECYLNGVATKSHDPSHAMQTLLPPSTSAASGISDFGMWKREMWEDEGEEERREERGGRIVVLYSSLIFINLSYRNIHS